MDYGSIRALMAIPEGGAQVNQMDLEGLPLKHLYRSLRNFPLERVASFLPALSGEQRQLLVDIDLWERDNLDIHQFEFWIRAYAACGDDNTILEFVQSMSFQLYLKGRFNIYTFDAEDPWYPENNNYFLTEDSLFLFEFHQDYPYVNEIKMLLLSLYSRWGVEKAYTFLFKTVSDHFSSFQECEYEDKKRRLSDHGFIDYYESLEFESCWRSFKDMDAALVRIQSGKPQVVKDVPANGSDMLIWREYGSMGDDFAKVKSEERKRYLEWDFVRLVNAVMAFDGVLKKSDSKEWEKTGRRVSNLLSLGRSYLRERFPEEEVLSECFDSCQIYKVGNTLIRMGRSPLNIAISKAGIEESFMGFFWSQFVADSLDSPCRFQGKGIVDMEAWWTWQSWCDGFIRLLPFMKSLYQTWKNLLEEGRVQSSFYLNYTTEEIDFEAVLLSSFANHYLSILNESSRRKMGLTLTEFCSFIAGVVDEEGKVGNIDESVDAFLSSYSLERIPHIREYFLDRLRTHLEGVDYASLSERDYKHIGGPVIFAF